MVNKSYAVIMAGGGGTRLWPLSRRSKPKQLLSLAQDRSLFQMAIDRLDGLLPPEHVLVVTVAEQAQLLMAQTPQIPQENFILEPMPRGTASVVGLAAVELWQRDPDAVMIVLTADHFISNVALFQNVLKSAIEIAQTGYLVTLGISPTYPSTGYGYIQRGKEIGTYSGCKGYNVIKFKEKPDEQTAREMLMKGDHEWNSGMFIWRVDRILDEFQLQMPELFSQLQSLSESKATGRYSECLQEVWPKIHPQTIDYGIMENAQQVAVIPVADMGWNDVGSWDSLFDVLPADEHGNICLCENHLEIDSTSSLIISDNPARLIATIGVEDLIIVDSGDSLLICRRDRSQQVKDVVQKIKGTQYNQYL